MTTAYERGENNFNRKRSKVESTKQEHNPIKKGSSLPPYHLRYVGTPPPLLLFLSGESTLIDVHYFLRWELHGSGSTDDNSACVLPCR